MLGAGKIENLPAEARDPKIYVGSYAEALVKYLRAARLRPADLSSAEENATAEGPLAGEYVVQWMSHGGAKLSIEVSPLDAARSTVNIGVSEGDKSGESACGFEVKLDGSRVVETSVAATCAG